MNLSPNGLAFLEHEEGVRLQPYKDAVGKDTIGVGHLLTPDELSSGNIVIDGATVPWQAGLTADQVAALLQDDCASRESSLSLLVQVPLTPNEFDALFSLYFNIGNHAFTGSTVLHLLNQRDYAGAGQHFLDWKYAGGKPILLGRRLRERALWQTP